MPIKINGTNTAANPSITGDDTDTGIVYGSDQIDLSTGGSSKVTLNGSNLGVGTTSPASPLHSHLASSDANRIRVTNSTTGATASDGFIVGLTSAEEGIIWNYENSSMLFGTNNTERMRITANGLLNLSGGGSANPWAATFKETGSSNSGRCFFEAVNGQANKTFSIMSENGKLRISGGGIAGSSTGTELISLLTTTSTSWTSGSDERLKENITEIPNALDKIKNYRCARFNFIGDDPSDIQNIKFGFIAQDWVTDFPEVLSLSTRNADDPTDKTKYYGMQYTETIPVLLKAIQELSAEVTTLKTKVAALEAA